MSSDVRLNLRTYTQCGRVLVFKRLRDSACGVGVMSRHLTERQPWRAVRAVPAKRAGNNLRTCLSWKARANFKCTA